MNKYIKDRLNTFNLLIKDMSILDGVNLAKSEVLELLKTYKPATVRTFLTFYRKELIVDSELITKALVIPIEEQKTIQKGYKKKLKKQQKQPIKIKDIDGMISKAMTLLNSSSPFEITAALCFLTGRRMTEILKTAKFTNSKNSTKVMLFKGQLKAKDKKPPYEIFVLNNARNECKEALKKVRALIDTSNMTNFEVSRKYETSVNAKINAWFSANIVNCSAHDLRNAYATYCILNYKPKNTITNSFLSELMGHMEDDISTSNSYQKYYIE